MLVAIVLDEWPHDAIDQQKFVVAAVAVIETESIDYYAEPVLVAKVLIMGVVSDGVPVGLSEIGEVVAVMVEAGVETGSVVLMGLPVVAVGGVPSQRWRRKRKCPNPFHHIDWDWMLLHQGQEQRGQIFQLDSN